MAHITTRSGGGYYFVSDGIESTLQQAKKAAGNKNVLVHGANIFQQYLKAGLVDEINFHLVAVLLRKGKRLFDHLPVEQIVVNSL